MRICFDTNVVLDMLLRRAPHAKQATRLFTRLEEKEMEGVLCATTLATAFYFVEKAYNSEWAHRDVRDLLQLFEIAAVDRRVLKEAVEAGFDDYEDAVLHEAARQARVDGIVTRNEDDFAAASLSIYTPAELVEALR